MPFRRLRHALTAALLGCALAAPAAHASFPGANGVLAFPAGAASIRNQDPVDLFASDGPDVLVRLAGGAGYQGAPAYAPDGKRLAYASDGAIVIVDPATGSRRLALGRPAGEPAWSADGRTLAFTSAGDVYSVAAAGGRVRRLTRDGSNSAPVFAPRGGRLAFVHAGTLVTTRPDGTGRSVLAARVLGADWAPDGRRLVAVRRLGAHAELWVLDATGRGARRLTIGADDLAARWSPDGTRIAFVRAGDVWTIALDGSGLRRVTAAGNVGAALAWQPLR
jgi:Tol biopolymer transport system component